MGDFVVVVLAPAALVHVLAVARRTLVVARSRARVPVAAVVVIAVAIVAMMLAMMLAIVPWPIVIVVVPRYRLVTMACIGRYRLVGYCVYE